MSRRVLIGFIFINVVVSLAVAWLVISFSRNQESDGEEPPAPQVQVMIVSATPPPGGDVPAADTIGTANALALTITALAQEAQNPLVITATPAEGEAGIAVAPAPTLPTINPSFLPPIPSELPPGLPSATPQSDGCIRYEVQSGDVIITIAQQYGVLPGDILLANGMDENDILNIGDILIIPVEGCDALNTATPIPSPSRTPFQLTRVVPTVTLPATATAAQITISNVLSWGDVNNEAVELRNLGSVVNLQGWTLASSDGEDIFYFPEFRMQQGSLVRVYSRQGSNTPAALYWGLDRPAWADGDTVSLVDASGQVQATYRVGSTTPG